ncbi:hypothetical protein PPRY_a3718 [Pseudoalteromonas prydzensis ACAM 620]|nr:hypothetical protein [Pseudoalteromonas prydzensis ACAM 620]
MRQLLAIQALYLSLALGRIGNTALRYKNKFFVDILNQRHGSVSIYFAKIIRIIIKASYLLLCFAIAYLGYSLTDDSAIKNQLPSHVY